MFWIRYKKIHSKTCFKTAFQNYNDLHPFECFSNESVTIPAHTPENTKHKHSRHERAGGNRKQIIYHTAGSLVMENTTNEKQHMLKSKRTVLFSWPGDGNGDILPEPLVVES